MRTRKSWSKPTAIWLKLTRKRSLKTTLLNDWSLICTATALTWGTWAKSDITSSQNIWRSCWWPRWSLVLSNTILGNKCASTLKPHRSHVSNLSTRSSWTRSTCSLVAHQNHSLFGQRKSNKASITDFLIGTKTTQTKTRTWNINAFICSHCSSAYRK